MSEFELSQLRRKAQEMVPPHMVKGLMRYVERGILPGDFLRSVLVNNLRLAVMYADESNRNSLANWVILLHNYAPVRCWGDQHAVRIWHNIGGLFGQADPDNYPPEEVSNDDS